MLDTGAPREPSAELVYDKTRDARPSRNATEPGTGRPGDLADALEDLLRFYRLFIVFPSERHAEAVALWAAHTHGLAAFGTTPYLAITSPQRGSGKTRLLEVLEETTRKAWRVAEPSAAVLFRKIETEQPTLLLDEMDGIFHAGSSASDSAQAIRAVLNSGNRRGAVVPRAANFGNDLVDFRVFCPKALAGLRRLPDTLADRSIPIPMMRRRREDRIERYRPRDHVPQANAIRDRLSRIVGAMERQLSEYRAPDHLAALTDRQVEAWEPLLAVAEAAGGAWPARARRAAEEIHKTDIEDADGLPTEVLLLQHVREAFEAADADRLVTDNLLADLRYRDDGPWAAMFDERFDENGLKSAQALAALLRPYGVRSKQMRFAGIQSRGYSRQDFADAWGRYL